jgi:small subunit ribosomal protein S9
MATKTATYFYGIGRRSTSVAKVRLVPGKGGITINDMPASEYFADSQYLLHRLGAGFTTLDLENKYDVTVKVSGGGHSGQADAIKLGVARALAIVNEDYKSTLKRADLLGRDPREKERKHFGLKKARKQRQFTKR